MKYVIVGACIAAVGAMEGIRAVDPRGEITVIDGEKRGAYTRPLISYLLVEPERFSNIDYRSPAFFEEHNVRLLPARAERIDRQQKQLLLDSGETIDYDRLLLATGARPWIPAIPGVEQDWVKSFYTIADAESINKLVDADKEMVIIGSGLIGMKAAEASLKRGLRVSLVEKEKLIMPRIMTAEAAFIMRKHLEDCGLNIITAEEVLAFLPEHMVKLGSGEHLRADMVIMAAGTRPQTELAIACGLTVNKGIKVDAQFRTSDPDIFAAGDVIETLNLCSGQTELMALLPHAHREGVLAGANMAGEENHYQGGIPLNSVSLMGWHICSAGDAGKEAEKILRWQNEKQYLELIFEEGYLSKYIAINLPEISGPLTTMLEKKLMIPPSEWEKLMSLRPSLSIIPGSYWQEIRRLEDYGNTERC